MTLHRKPDHTMPRTTKPDRFRFHRSHATVRRADAFTSGHGGRHPGDALFDPADRVLPLRPSTSEARSFVRDGGGKKLPRAVWGSGREV